MNNSTFPTKIDLERIINSKKPNISKKIPKFLMKYLKQIIHEEELNSLLSNTASLNWEQFINYVIEYLEVKITVTGHENIPTTEGCIIACNHPLGGIDGVSILHVLSKVRKDIFSLSNDLLLNIPNIKTMMIPINKHGKNSIQNLKRIDQVYASNTCLLVFPAGMVSRLNKGKISDLKWNDSIVKQAIKHKKKIIPVYIDARNSSLFYFVASFRKLVGIKSNLEMFLLIHEAFKQKGKTIKIYIGEPILYSSFTRNLSFEYWTQSLREKVYSLKKHP